jgi:Domain of unknown function (DUF5916)/Carbohydrate family 9 binding domain-like
MMGNMVRTAGVIIAIGLFAVGLVAQQQVRVAAIPAVLTSGARTGAPVMEAVPVSGEAPRIDGDLTDAAWQTAAVATSFVQFRPDEGDAASERTEVRVLYGETSLFISFRAFDREPEKIEGQLTRRDQQSFSDRVHVLIDSYNDKRTAFHFAVNPKGVKQDYYRFDDTSEDPGWDAVWEVATAVDSQGWSAEFEIPYSQLRFARAESQTWGINFQRDIARKNETAFWAPISGQDNAMVSKFGSLRGLKDLAPPRRLEVTPYSLARLQRAPGDTNDPFYRENDTFGTMGVDLKYGLTSNLTLDVSVNPDFGQVEADPAQVNLSAFETFFPERRPFFIEGANIFNFGISLGDGGNESLFYSRRIGRTPQGRANPQGGYADASPNTTIQVATKLSGKTESGWSIGLMHASTSREDAAIVTGDGVSLNQMIEPRTQYGVARIQKDFREGRSAIGLIGTGVVRAADAAADLNLHKNAVTGGLDFRHRFGNDKYEVSGYALGSRVTGTADAIARTQRAAGRYLQRPGVDHLNYDPTRTSLSGMTAAAKVGKINGGFWRYQAGFQTRSPEFETNDIGFLRDVDFTFGWGWVGYQHYLPTKHFRRWNLNANAWTSRSYGGEKTGTGGNINGSFQLSNWWNGWLGVNYQQGATSRGLLRGGPSFQTENQINGWAGFGSDSRKQIQFNINFFGSRRPESDSWSFNASPNLTWRPSGRARISVGSFYNRNVDDRQWVTRLALNEDQYIFGRIDQQTVGVTGRVDFSFTPDLSLQLYAQPFVSAGSYSDFKRVADPQGATYADRFDLLDTEVVDGTHRADVDGDGTTERIGNPDFNFKQFRSNAVLRWEFRPGSALFIVWSQGRDQFSRSGDFNFRSDLGTLFGAPTDNVFMVKFTYWMNP